MWWIQCLAFADYKYTTSKTCSSFKKGRNYFKMHLALLNGKSFINDICNVLVNLSLASTSCKPKFSKCTNAT